ncbi:calmodulin-regulated spectrin-associated protein 3-like, partial [Chlamydotis macqueenii]
MPPPRPPPLPLPCPHLAPAAALPPAAAPARTHPNISERRRTHSNTSEPNPSPPEHLRAHPKPLRTSPSPPEARPGRSRNRARAPPPPPVSAAPPGAPGMVAAPPAAAAAMRRGFLVPEIRPLDQYDGARARSAASLAWVIATGYGGADQVPAELRQPLCTDASGEERVTPAVSRLLLTSDLYCRAWRRAPRPPPAAPPPPDLGALLALLAARGVGPVLRGSPVREEELRQEPLQLDAHLALIDALMAAFIAEATHSLGPPPGAPPGPAAWEPKILCWLDTVNRKLQESTEREGAPKTAPPDGSAAPPACGHKCPTRWYWKLVPHAIAFCLKESGNKPPV